ncbi:MAG: Eco29kI family restriction endonuclease [Hormoscilla sp. GM102CHS1]|nr:Eco29kI family restriction endonuclease [Hormoscilla sp. GM102CHS1]
MLEIFQVPKLLADELLEFSDRQDCYSLTEMEDLKTELSQYVGVYALYYRGANPLYACISRANSDRCCLPIYVGKAIAGGRRTGRTEGRTSNLYNRLREHQRSIEKGDGLSVSEFEFKVVAMEVDLVSWGEGVMIRHFQPVWNQIVDGFGNHDPGRGRYQQKRSVWDLLHPGREWAQRLTNFDPLDYAAILDRVEALCLDSSQRVGCTT